MVASLIPRLAGALGTSAQTIGLIVLAYMIPYGVSTLFYCLLSDRIGRRSILFASLLAFVVLTALTATAQSASELIAWRLFPYEQRGRPLGWLFGAMAGGMAFASTVGVILKPFVGWRMLFIAVALAGGLILCLLLPYRSLLGDAPTRSRLSLKEVFTGYRGLLASERGLRTYGFVFLNAVFHSRVFTWLALYFENRYGLGEVGIGLALLGYGVPGFPFGPIVGRAADQ